MFNRKWFDRLLFTFGLRCEEGCSALDIDSSKICTHPLHYACITIDHVLLCKQMLTVLRCEGINGRDNQLSQSQRWKGTRKEALSIEEVGDSEESGCPLGGQTSR